MTQAATPQTIVAAPGDVLQEHDGQLWYENRPVVLTTGSHNQQIYWYATGRGRTLGQVPMIWLTTERQWIPRRAAIMHPPGQTAPPETGAWNAICVACHTTDGRPRFDTPFGSQPIDTQTVDTTATELGIACESCHGPAYEHARVNRNPVRRYTLHFTGAADETVVQPARLTPKQSAQVCGQCHSFWEFRDAQSERAANTRGLPYRPGDELSATRFIVQPTQNGDSREMQAFLAADRGFIRDIFWSDGMVRATGREYNALIESPCFKNAKDDRHTLTCASCHTMHQTVDDTRPVAAWANDQLNARGESNETCLACHGSTANHSNHAAASSGSVCMNCHMPYTTYGLLKTIRSHQINNPSVQSTLDTGRPNACNLCHLDKTLAWTAQTMQRWYKTPMPVLDDDQRTVAASVLTLLKGDAGQRAIVAQAMGWRAAQDASGTGWMAPYLALMQRDAYDAVRLIAARSSRTLPPFRREDLPRNAPQLLINGDGTFNTDIVNRLVRARDNRRVVYRE